MSPKTVFENEEKVEVHNEVTYQPRVKQMVRKIGAGFTTTGAESSQSVDEELSTWINNGWKLFATHYTGSEPDGVVVLYILTKD